MFACHWLLSGTIIVLKPRQPGSFIPRGGMKLQSWPCVWGCIWQCIVHLLSRPSILPSPQVSRTCREYACGCLITSLCIDPLELYYVYVSIFLLFSTYWFEVGRRFREKRYQMANWAQALRPTCFISHLYCRQRTTWRVHRSVTAVPDETAPWCLWSWRASPMHIYTYIIIYT